MIKRHKDVRSLLVKSIKLSLLSALLVGCSLYLEPAMAFFFKKNLTAEEFVQYIKKEQQEGHVSKLTDFEIKGYEFPLREMKSAHFKNTRWQSIEAEGRTFEKVLFEDCELKNINFREVVLKDVTFKNCTLSNVVMNKAIIKNLTFEKSKLVSIDSNIDHSYR